MKPSIHLFYGIIIGVLICACTGSIKSDKAEFEVEKVEKLGSLRSVDGNLSELREEGWTIIDIGILGEALSTTYFYAHVGK